MTEHQPVRENLVRLISYGVAVVRFAVSAMFALAPEQTMSRIYGDEVATSKSAVWAVRHFVARDFILGAGLWRALSTYQRARSWMAAGTLVDVIDAGTIAALQPDSRIRESLLLRMAAVIVIDAALTAGLRADPRGRG